MWLFPQSLGGQAMEWFSKLPSNIYSFDQLAFVFITQHSYNIEKDVTMIELCNTKQLLVESFEHFLQIWWCTFSKYHREILEKEKTDIFINSLFKPMNCWIQLQGPKYFKTMLENVAK